jgi:hypothetical protein
VYFSGPIVLADFEIIPIQSVKNYFFFFFGGGVIVVRGQSLLIGVGMRGSVRMGRLRMISKSDKRLGPLKYTSF